MIGMKKLDKIEKNLKTDGPKRTQEGYSLRSNEEICSKIQDLEVKIK